MTLELRDILPEQLVPFFRQQRWFGGKARKIERVDVTDIVPIAVDGINAVLLIARVHYAEGDQERYAIPVIVVEKMSSEPEDSAAILTIRQADGVELVLSDALKSERFLASFLESISRGSRFIGEKGELRVVITSDLNDVHNCSGTDCKPKVLTGEQSNSSVVYGDRFILKFFRRLELGINPEVEIGAFLTRKPKFPHTPALVAWIEYRTPESEPVTQAVLQCFVPNEGDAWRYTLKCIARFYEAASQVSSHDAQPAPKSFAPPEQPTELPEFARGIAGPYLDLAGLLGRRTAELHQALASNSDAAAFAPEPFTMEFQRNLAESRAELAERVLSLLHEQVPRLPGDLRQRASKLAGRKHEIAHRFESMLAKPIQAVRTRIHGDYHLGQVLFTGSDFVIIDFEGEPARPLAERRSKQSPLQDVAGMLRSFHYAAFAPLLGTGEQATSGADLGGLEGWAEAWYSWVASRFLAEYFRISQDASYLPPDRKEADDLLQVFLLEKAIYELGYELNNRPAWVGIPVEGITRLLSAA